MGNKVILLIIDGLGVGEMPDAPKRDRGANTIKNVAKEVESLKLQNFEKIGMGNIDKIPGMNAVGENAIASFGKCMLKHFGADTFDGHNEIMGTKPKRPFKRLFREELKKVKKALEKGGYKVTIPFPKMPILAVNEAVVIADNLETDPDRSVFNITAPLDYISFEEVMKIGKLVRETVKVARVIAFGSTGYDLGDILKNAKKGVGGKIGIDAPALGVYNENYMCVHMGYGIDPVKQIPTILGRHGVKVVLIGKVQDLIQCDTAIKIPAVPTYKVLNSVLAQMKSDKNTFIAATVQETDLAGHEQDPFKYAAKLKIVDKGIGKILQHLKNKDIFIVTADHGNDPTKHKWHTREYTPLLITGKNIKKGANLGVRETLADIAATIAEVFHVERPESGVSFYKEIIMN